MYTINMKKILTVLMVITLILSFTINVHANDLLNYFNSINYNNETILSDQEIINFNDSIEKDVLSVNNSILDLSTINSLDIFNFIKTISIKSNYNRYSSSKELLDDEYYNLLYENINIDGIYETKYGLITRRTPLKKFPTTDKAFSSITSIYDRFLESTLYVGEPITILHESLDEKWYFISMYNYMGWVNKDDIALTSLEVINMYINCPNFITITSPNTLSVNNSIQLDLGSNIPLLSVDKNYDLVGLIPTRNINGQLYFIKDAINRIDSYKGYMDYTTKNLINITLKLIGEPYGWGGDNNARDCSSFVMDIYRVFGIKLPRNTDQQELVPSYSKEIHSSSDFNNLSTGSLLFMNGHIMIYLGNHNGINYMIHDTPGYYSNGKYINANGVTINDFNIYSSSGIKYENLIYKAITIK